MGVESFDPLRQLLHSEHGISSRCQIRGCMERPVKGSYLCSQHRDTAENFFTAQLGLDPLYHMKHNVQLQYDTAWTYFVGSREHKMVKIGQTTKLKARMSSLRNSSPVPVKLFAVVFGSPSIEYALHERFSESRMHGEWFKLTDEISDCIEAIKARDFAKYIPESLCLNSMEDHVDYILKQIELREDMNHYRWKTKTAALDILNSKS